jgi:hypothetical protein
VTTDQLDSLLTLLRRHGVQEYSDGTVRVVLAPSAPASMASPDLTQALAPTLCRCGHAKHDHSGDVGCLHGCEMRVCVPEGAGS